MGRWSNYSKMNHNKRMSILTINLSDELFDMLALGKARGWWASRSEGIRVALGRGLPILIQEKEEMQELVLQSLQGDGKLDPKKDYIRIPGKGYIEIVGEA